MNLKLIRLLILSYEVVRLYLGIGYFYDLFYETKNFEDFKKYPYPKLPVEENGVRFEEVITIYENEIYSVSYRDIEVYRNNSWHDKV